jgi:hypothetical protein
MIIILSEVKNLLSDFDNHPVNREKILRFLPAGSRSE